MSIKMASLSQADCVEQEEERTEDGMGKKT